MQAIGRRNTPEVRRRALPPRNKLPIGGISYKICAKLWNVSLITTIPVCANCRHMRLTACPLHLLDRSGFAR